MTTNARIADTIAKAVELNATIKKLTAELEGHKKTLRTEAEKLNAKSGTGEMIEFESPAGTATVSFVRDAAAPIKGANLRELKGQLPDETWTDMFDEVVTLATGFSDKFDALKKKQQTIIAGYVEWHARDPRVTLPK